MDSTSARSRRSAVEDPSTVGRGSSGPPTGRLDGFAIAAAIGAAVSTGVFFSWSTMVMPALGALPAAEAIGSMQVLNAVAPVPFSVIALATAALCCVAIVRSFGTTAGRLSLAGGLVFAASALVVTFAANVPLSASIDRLATAPSSTGAWRELATHWIWWNHLRALGSVVATIALTVAVFARRDRCSRRR